jgi:NitT/TauT family transport system permease protein
VSETRALNKLAVIVVLVTAWELYVRISGVSELLLPAPSKVAVTMAGYLVSGKLLIYTWETVKTLLMGMAIGMVVAFCLTILATLSRFGKDLLTTLTSMFNPLPAVALLPLALLWLGIGVKSLLFVIANSVVWAMALNTHMGFETVPLALRRAGRNLGLEGWALIRDVYLPAALPYILTGIKISWSFGWRTIIAAELVFGASGRQGGLGWLINVERYNLNTAGIFSGLVTIILIGLLVESLFQQLEKRTIRKWGMTVG